jgi:hypothetical protein
MDSRDLPENYVPAVVRVEGCPQWNPGNWGGADFDQKTRQYGGGYASRALMPTTTRGVFDVGEPWGPFTGDPDRAVFFGAAQPSRDPGNPFLRTTNRFSLVRRPVMLTGEQYTPTASGNFGTFRHRGEGGNYLRADGSATWSGTMQQHFATVVMVIPE